MTAVTTSRISEARMAELLARAALPAAPMAMPKQVLEVQHSWLFAIYTRLVRRT